MTAPALAARELAAHARTSLRPSVVLALALPVVFLHRRYQPDLGVAVGGTTVDVFGSDIAILAVVVTAAAEAVRAGMSRLRPALPLWIAAAAFLAWILAATLYAPGVSYRTTAHLVTAFKYGEYALLAPASVLLLRSHRDVGLVLRAAVVWSVVATAVAILQFVGAVPANEAYGTGTREPSLIGIHEFACFSGAVLALGFSAILLGAADRRWELAACVAGALGVVLAAAMDAVAGVVIAAVLLWAVAHARRLVSARRTISLAAVTALVVAGAVSLRGPTVNAFLEFIGLKPKTEQVTGNVQSWGQRVTLGYIGLRVFLAHPLLGAGWQATTEYATLAPYVPAAKRRFPDQPAQAFPSAGQPWGVQNTPVQLLADLGVVGFLLALTTLLTGVVVAARAVTRGPPETVRRGLVTLGWLSAAVGVSLGVGLVAGTPLSAVLWLGLGLAATLAGSTRTAAG